MNCGKNSFVLHSLRIHGFITSLLLGLPFTGPASHPGPLLCLIHFLPLVSLRCLLAVPLRNQPLSIHCHCLLSIPNLPFTSCLSCPASRTIVICRDLNGGPTHPSFPSGHRFFFNPFCLVIPRLASHCCCIHTLQYHSSSFSFIFYYIIFWTLLYRVSLLLLLSHDKGLHCCL